MNAPPDFSDEETLPAEAVGARLPVGLVDGTEEALDRIAAIANLLLVIRRQDDLLLLGEQTIAIAAQFLLDEAQHIRRLLHEAHPPAQEVTA